MDGIFTMPLSPNRPMEAWRYNCTVTSFDVGLDEVKRTWTAGALKHWQTESSVYGLKDAAIFHDSLSAIKRIAVAPHPGLTQGLFLVA